MRFATGRGSDYTDLSVLVSIFLQSFRQCDVVVLDTPPSRHALDFLDAPERLLRLLENRVFRVLITPARTGLRIAGVAVQALVRTASRVIGTEVVDDIVAFFRAFEGMEEGFRARARRVREVIAEPTTTFVLVTSPRRDAVLEAEYFAQGVEAFASLAKRPGCESTHCHTRFELFRKDPALHEFIRKVVDVDVLANSSAREGLLEAAAEVALRCGRREDAEVAVEWMAPGPVRERIASRVQLAGVLADGR